MVDQPLGFTSISACCACYIYIASLPRIFLDSILCCAFPLELIVGWTRQLSGHGGGCQRSVWFLHYIPLVFLLCSIIESVGHTEAVSRCCYQVTQLRSACGQLCVSVKYLFLCGWHDRGVCRFGVFLVRYGNAINYCR